MFLPAGTTHFQLSDAPLKHLLRLFAPEAPLHIRELCDTGHPSAGYINEELVRGVMRVSELLAFPYDFAGLVYLDATVANLILNYQESHYQFAGPSKAIQLVLARLRILNAQPGALPLRVLTAT